MNYCNKQVKICSVVVIVLSVLVVSYICESSFLSPLQDKDHWINLGKSEIEEALNVKLNTKKAKNVILFVGDGMGPNTLTAARLYKYGESGNLIFEKFPHVGYLKTYSVDKQVPDSASTATALFCGVKTNYETSGVDASVKLADCEASLNKNSQLDSIIAWAQAAGKSTGFVTTTRVMHATPSALYAHSADRRWECEAKMPAGTESCKDIARQLVEDAPGKNINVIMGGGRQCLVSNVTDSEADPIDTWSCISKDGRDLITKWKKDKAERKLNYEVLSNNRDLTKLNTAKTDYVLGVFANGHLKYDSERDHGPNGMPSIRQMTEAAIKILEKNNNGYVLVVEGGMIDQAHHRGFARQALNEAIAMEDAVKAAVEATNREADKSLIIITSDHSHTLTINGYAPRGADVLGIASYSKMDGKPYTTLTYGTGGPGSAQIENGSRRDPSLDNTTSYSYAQQTVIETDENTHGGSDVHVFAKGPFAHLFHNIHEQSYVAYVIGYAAQIGPYKKKSLYNAIFDK